MRLQARVGQHFLDKFKWLGRPHDQHQIAAGGGSETRVRPGARGFVWRNSEHQKRHVGEQEEQKNGNPLFGITAGVILINRPVVVICPSAFTSEASERVCREQEDQQKMVIHFWRLPQVLS